MAHFIIPQLTNAKQPTLLSERGKYFFAQAIARAAGLEAVQNARTTPLGRLDLRDLFLDIQTLVGSGIASAWGRAPIMPDEPPFCSWWIEIVKEKSGGLSVNDDREALRAAVSEAQERQIWKYERDYFRRRTSASFQELGAGKAVHPLRFAGYSSAQRARDPIFSLSETTRLLWIDGYSLIQKRRILVPAQIVSRRHAFEALRRHEEQFIREPITTGLATHLDRTRAILSGALEIIERDAFMITWLNHLSPPRIAHDSLTEENESLKELLGRCERYNLDVHFVRLISDAPAYVVMSVVRDPRKCTPISIGTCAHSSASHAAEKSLLEALRARRNARSLVKKRGPLTKKTNEMHFADRHVYWASPSRSNLVDFLTGGKETSFEVAAWHNDTPQEHLQRIVKWCAERKYECISVDLGTSKKNVLGLDIAFVIIPEMQPLYLHEKNRCEGGDRLRSVPEKFGYTPREQLFTEEPHPFV